MAADWRQVFADWYLDPCSEKVIECCLWKSRESYSWALPILLYSQALGNMCIANALLELNTVQPLTRKRVRLMRFP